MSALFTAVASTLLSMAGGSVQSLNVQVTLDETDIAPETQATDGSAIQQLLESAVAEPADAVGSLNDILAAAQARTQDELTEEADPTGTIQPADEPQRVDLVDAGPEIHATLEQLAGAFDTDEPTTDLPFAATNSDEIPSFDQTPEFADEENVEESPAETSQDGLEIDDTLDAADSPWTYIEASAESRDGKWLHRIGEQVKQCVAGLFD